MKHSERLRKIANCHSVFAKAQVHPLHHPHPCLVQRNAQAMVAGWPLAGHSPSFHTILQYFTLKFQKSTDLSTRSAPNRSDFRLVRLFCLDIKLDSIFPNSINHQIVTLGEEYFTLTAESCSIVGKQGLP